MEIPVRHMVVTGQTQESGKTTTLEALISRSRLPAIAFLTKRGEKSLAGRQILPYFRERADWRFVESILESTMHERMKFERAWIVRACQGKHSLQDVMTRLPKLEADARNAMSKDVYMLLGEYLGKVVPLIASLPKTNCVDLHDGLSVMDLIRYPVELQMLVIASTLEWIHQHSNGVITVIPEAWKFIPEGRNTPVKVIAENLSREGAGLKNYLWIDSQDIAGVWKVILRACAVWLVGVQREANEVKRSLANMPEGMKRPKAGDVATLDLGQFFCCHKQELRKVYVQPAWMDSNLAVQVAQGRISPAQVGPMPSFQSVEDEVMWKQKYEEAVLRIASLEQELRDLRRRESQDPSPASAGDPRKVADESPLAAPANVPAPSDVPVPAAPDVSTIVARVIEQIRRDPVLVRLAVEKPAIEVSIKRKVIAMSTDTIKGKLARLIHEGWFQQRRSQQEIRAELVRRGMGASTGAGFTEPLNALVQDGFLFRAGPDIYELAPDAEVRVVSA